MNPPLMFLISLLMSVNAFASTPISVADAQLEILFGAKNMSELRAAVVDKGSVQALARDCELEISLQRVPIACFAEATLRRTHNLLTSQDYERKTRALSSFCRQVARSSKDLRSLKASLLSETVSLSCRTTVERRVADLEYQVGEVRDLDRFLN